MSKLSVITKSSCALLLMFPGIILNPSSIENTRDGFLLSGISVSAADQTNTAIKRKTRKTPAMRSRIYSQLARAQKLADEQKVDEGIAVLDRVKSRIEQLNSYEKAMLWNFYGFIYYGKNDSQSAMKAFEKVVEQENIPESLELSTLFSLAQLSMAAENYNQTIYYLDRWAAVKGDGLNDNALVLKANAYYAMKDYPKALSAVTNAVTRSKSEGKLPKEQWLVLQRALNYELNDIKKVTQISEELVRHYSKPKYWTELANMYGETDQTDKQLAVMEAAYQQGYVSKKSDFRTLAQLYYFSGAPAKSAKLLSEQLKSGNIESDVKTLRFLAQAWTTAKETQKAIPVLQKAADLSKDGNMDAKLAESYIELEQWQKAIESANVATKKGALENRGNVFVAKGMAYFNLKKYDDAIANFKLAKKEKQHKKMASQWLKYAEKEKQKYEQLQASVAALGY